MKLAYTRFRGRKTLRNLFMGALALTTVAVIGCGFDSQNNHVYSVPKNQEPELCKGEKYNIKSDGIEIGETSILINGIKSNSGLGGRPLKLSVTISNPGLFNPSRKLSIKLGEPVEVTIDGKPKTLVFTHVSKGNFFKREFTFYVY